MRKKPGWWPEKKKLEVCTLFNAGVVSSSDLERLTLVPAATIREWRRSEWWTEMSETVHESMDAEVDAKYSKIINKSLEVVQDRLESGDFVMTKYGDLKRKPMNGKDAANINAIVVDKRQLLRNKPKAEAQTSTDKRLANLAEEFTKFMKAKDVTPEALTSPAIEVVYEEVKK